MTEEEIKFDKLKQSLLEAMARKRGTGLRVTVESFLAAAELVRNEQAEVLEIGREIWIREPV
jgi:hypothetical protein